MSLIPFRRKSSQMARVARLARFVGRQSAPDVRARLTSQIADMGPHEARGYVRARAGSVIYRQADLVLAGAGELAAVWQAQLIAQATDQVVDQVVRDLASAKAAPVEIRKIA